MQCFSYAIRSQSPQFHWACLQCSLQHTHTTSEIASIACLHDFSGPALLTCSKILTYKLLGSQLWTALPLEVSKSRHIDNSRTKLRIQVSNDEKRDIIELYLHCKFQSLTFCVRRRNGVTDRKIAPKVQMPR